MINLSPSFSTPLVPVLSALISALVSWMEPAKARISDFKLCATVSYSAVLSLKTGAGVLSASGARNFLRSAMASNISSVTAAFRELVGCPENAKASLGHHFQGVCPVPEHPDLGTE